jgi:uncharacterized membrane protein
MHFALNSPVTGLVAGLILSAAARALPEPVVTGNQFYLWFYRFSHLLLANFDKSSPGKWTAQ